MEPFSERRRGFSYEDPRLEIHELRARNDFKLKSAFELIFEKYGQDFTGIGDEIDLEVGEIVVNNGHVRGMRDEADVGYDEDDTEGDELANDMLCDSGEEDPPLGYMETSLDLREEEQEHPTTIADPKLSQSVMDDGDSLMGNVQNIDLVPPEGDSTIAVFDRQLVSESGNPGRNLEFIDAAAHLGTPNMTSFGSARSYGNPVLPQSGVKTPDPYEAVVEPAWRAPPLPAKALGREIRAATTRLPDRIEPRRQRSLSPTKASLWAPEKSPSQRRKDSRRTRLTGLLAPNSGPTVATQPRRERGMAPKGLTTPSERREALSSPPARARSIKVRRRLHESLPATENRIWSDNPSGAQADGIWSTEEDKLSIHLKATTEEDFHRVENYLPGGTWHSIQSRWYATGPSTSLWTEEDDRLLWHLKTNTKLVEREMVPYFSRKTQRQIRYRWHYSKDFARNKETFNTNLPGVATVRDDRWLQELLANSVLPPAVQSAERSPAEPAQIALHHDEQSMPGRKVNGDISNVTPAEINNELGLNLDISHDVVAMKEEPLERPLLTPTERSAALISSQKPSPVTFQQSPHQKSSANAIMPRTSSPSRPKSQLVRRPSKSRTRVRQSTQSNRTTNGAKLHANTLPSTPSKSQQHSSRFTKATLTVSFTSMLGYDSEEDELSWLEKNVGTPKIGRATTPVSTARKCGTLGFRCTRSVCLSCD